MANYTGKEAKTYYNLVFADLYKTSSCHGQMVNIQLISPCSLYVKQNASWCPSTTNYSDYTALKWRE